MVYPVYFILMLNFSFLLSWFLAEKLLCWVLTFSILFLPCFVVNTETRQEQRTKFTATVTDLKPPPAENLMVERVQGNNGSVKRVKSPITATSYTVASLQTATNSFSQEFLIGEGSLGRVYRADFSNGKVFMCDFVHEIICHTSTVLNGYDVN